MDTTTYHDLPALFAQLGLPDSSAAIRQFIQRHRPLPQTLNLSEAPFWNAGQAAFLREQWQADDGDWCVQIDRLNALLREHPDPQDLAQAEDGRGGVSARR